MGGEVSDGSPSAVLRTTTFEQFYACEYRSCAALAYSLCGNLGLAEEIAQDAMTTAYREWDRIRQMELPGSWVRRTTANMATSAVRRRAAEARAVLRMSSRRQVDAVLPESDEDFWRAVRRLPRRQAQATALRYGLGCTVPEVAQILGCAEGTVKASLHAARTAVSRQLAVEADA